MRVFQNKAFQRFARREGIDADDLCEAVERAEGGKVDAELGGGVIKQRIPRPGAGRSGGFRSIILYRPGDLAVFVYGFPKSERSNITDDELKGFRQLAGIILAFTAKELLAALQAGALTEVICDA